MPRDYVRAGVLVAVVVSAAVFAGLTTAASEPSITAADDSPGATTEHTATVVVDGNAAGGSWNGFQIDYEATDVSNVGQGDIQTIGIDRGNDDSGTAIDEDVSNDLSSAGADNNGQSLDIGLDGSSNIQSGDELVVVFADAQNPGSSGEYNVTLHINQGSADETAQTTLSIGATSTPTPTATQTQTQTQTATQTQTQTQTATATATQTATATATQTQTPTQTATQTPTATATPTPTQTATTSGSDGDISAPDPDPAGAVSETEPSVSSTPDTAGATATHTVGTLVGNEIGDSSWTGLEVNYSGTGTDVSNVGQGDVVKIGVDRGNNDSNATIDRSLAASVGEVSGSNDGETLTLGLDGDYELAEGDQIIVVCEDVQNPDAGDYSVGIDVNPQSGGDEVNAALDVDATTTTATATETAEPTDTATAEPTATQTDAPTTTAESSPSTSPGFGAVAAAVALVAAAALLVRR